MIIDDITRDDVIIVLELVQSTCAMNDDCCQSCPYADHRKYNECVLAHVPERWKLDNIGGDQYD